MPQPQIRDNVKLFQEVAAFYDAYLGSLNLKEQLLLREMISQLSKKIDKSLPVLDSGSGMGNVAKYLERAGL